MGMFLDAFRNFLWRRRHRRALIRYGWDGKCRKCGAWHHTDGAASLEAETAMHWHYRCRCGWLNSYNLIYPLPIADDDTGRAALAQEQR